MGKMEQEEGDQYLNHFAITKGHQRQGEEILLWGDDGEQRAPPCAGDSRLRSSPFPERARRSTECELRPEPPTVTA